MTTWSARVAASSDDAWAENLGVGYAPTLTGVMRFGNGANRLSAGMRFANVTIPQGSTINSATLTIAANADYTTASTISVTLACQAADNAATFIAGVPGDGNLSATTRPRTTLTSGWDLHAMAANTPLSKDITAQVQAVINRAGWVSGNAIVVIADDNSSTSAEWQDIDSYDSSSSRAPLLSIDYTAGGAGTTGTATMRAQAAQPTASGTVTPPARTGTVSISAQAPRLSASGTQTISGTASVTAQPVSISASGAESFAGSASFSGQPSSLASQSAESFTGTTSEVAAPASLSASGTITTPSFTGTASVSAQPAQVTAMGTNTPLAVTGTAAITLASSSVTATGTFGSDHQRLVGNGYTDGSAKQLVRTSDDRLWIASWQFITYPEGNHSSGLGQTLMMYRADQTGLPTSFTRTDSANEPTNPVSWSLAVDGSDLLHVLWVERASWNDGTGIGTCQHLHYATFDTATNLWGTVEDVDTALAVTEIGQGDELCGMALDSDGVPHVVYLKSDGTQRRVNYRNRIGGTWSAASIVDDQSFGVNEKCWHPAIAFDQAGRRVVLWHRGAFNGDNTGRIFCRTYDGSWGTTADVVGADVYVGIDTTSALYIDGRGRYHTAYTSATNKYVRYSYSDNLGATWTANNPADQVGDDPQVGPGANGNVRIYAHGTDATPNIVYWEAVGGGAAWGSTADYFADSATAFDCTVNVRWSRYFHAHFERLDIAYWQSVYGTANGNQLYIGSDTTAFTGTASASLSPVTVTGAAAETFTGTASESLPGARVTAAGTNTPPAGTPITGSASLTLPAAQMVATGSVVPPARTGTASISLSPASIAASGSVGTPAIIGTGSVVVQAGQIAAAAWEAYEGTGSAQAQPAAISGAGEVITPAIAGVVVMALAAATIGASGTVAMSEYTGTAAMILAPIAIVASGTGATVPQIGTAALAVAVLYTASLSVAALGGASITVEAG